MKKKSALFLTGITLACLVLGASACDGEQAAGMQTGSGETNSVTSAEWEASIGGIVNCTVETKKSFADPNIMTRAKFDGDRFGQESFSESGEAVPGETYFMCKEGEEHFIYVYGKKDTWKKEECSSEVYEAAAASQRSLLECLSRSYDKFSFESGKYICSSLACSVNDRWVVVAVQLEEIAVSFEQGKVAEIVFLEKLNGESVACRMTDIGSTKIELPKVEAED